MLNSTINMLGCAFSSYKGYGTYLAFFISAIVMVNIWIFIKSRKKV